jgi:fatty-acyl-CoA synthase
MKSTMQDAPLTVARIVRHARDVHPTAEVVTATDGGTRAATLGDVAGRAGRLAHALRSLGIHGDERVATFMWNNQEHLEAYFAVPSMGAVLHTLNIRLSVEQLVFIAGHAEDRVVLVDDSLVGTLLPALDEMTTVRHVVVSGPDSAARVAELAGRSFEVHDYEALIAQYPAEFDWPDVDERDAAALCYTSGTTGDPKGVAYSHRSIYVHSMAIAMGDGFRIDTDDRVLPVVPMFHANAWGMPYAAAMIGASLTLPDRFMGAEQLVAFIERSRPTLGAGVPTVWNDVISRARSHGGDLGSFKVVIGGGALVPVSLQREMMDVCGVLMVQAWGMTETSPTAVVSWPPTGIDGDEMWRFRAKQGRLMSCVEGRVVGDDGRVLPSDGRAVGELEVRGPYVTRGYYLQPDVLHDGWLRTGDLGTIDELGFIAITDRAKDMIKSGGEWISSVDLEAAIMAHPAVSEAAVIGIPDPKWQERPLGIVALRPGAEVTTDELRDFLARTFAKWQIPETWTFVEQIPRTSVGKFDKKVMRAMQADHAFDVV